MLNIFVCVAYAKFPVQTSPLPPLPPKLDNKLWPMFAYLTRLAWKHKTKSVAAGGGRGPDIFILCRSMQGMKTFAQNVLVCPLTVWCLTCAMPPHSFHLVFITSTVDIESSASAIISTSLFVSMWNCGMEVPHVTPNE